MFYLLQDQLKSTSVIVGQGGVEAARQFFYPYGGNRGGATFSDLTTRRFTGQYHEQGLPGAEGLSFYNARWYDPQLGRFVSPDTIVPQPSFPQDFNRYSYARNNPLRYDDPSGHCPAPSSKSGIVICVDFFIQTPTILLGSGYGDGRDFSSNSDASRSRANFYIYIDVQGNVTSVEEHVNPSCLITGACFQPLKRYNTLNVHQDSDTKDISLEWNLTNGVSSSLLNLGERIYQAEASIGASANGSTIVEVAGKVIPAINGKMKLHRLQSGLFQVIQLDRDPYPSLEVYHYEAGKLVGTLLQSREGALPGNLGPILLLNPLAPKDKFDRHLSRER